MLWGWLAAQGNLLLPLLPGPAMALALPILLLLPGPAI